MNALRTLPILNRPSRPASPAPPSTSTSTVHAQAHAPLPSGLGLGITHTASEPGKTRARSHSRIVADKAANGGVPPVGNGKAPSPSTRAATPRLVSTPLPGQEPPATPGSGYMDVLGLRLNEAVNKACVGVDYKSKKPFKKGCGWALGENIIKEFPAPPADAYLIRAVIRTAVRSISIYITRLEALLLPALTDPSFVHALNLTAPASAAHPLNPAQYFALSVAHTAWETCEVLEQTLETGNWPRYVNETLRPVMDKLDLVVGKVVQPLLLGLRKDLVASLNRIEGVSPTTGKPIVLAHTPVPATGPAVPVAREHSNAPLSRLTKEPSSGGHSRAAQIPVPICLQHFAARVDGARKVLDLVAKPCADDGEGWVTGVIVAVVWKGMCIIAEKDIGPNGNRPPSPSSVNKALNNLKLDKEGNPTAPAPALGGVTAKLTTILPSRSVSRPPSPPRGVRWDPMTHALLSLEGLVKRLVTGLVEPAPAPHTAPGEPPAPEHIAREAVFEALEALTSFHTVSAAAHGYNASTRLLASSRRIRDDVDDDADEALDDAMEDMPAVTLLSVFLRRANLALASLAPSQGGEALRVRGPAELWGWSNAEYERQALSGFAAAEDWGKRVATALKPEIERVMVVLGALAKEQQGNKEIGEAMDWVRCLGVCCEARGGVRIPAAV